VILGPGRAATVEYQPTLDDLFRAAARRNPDRVALVDSPQRAAWTDDAPRALTYAEADRIVDAVAARLRELGLPTDSIVAVQMPHTVDGALVLLGILRAGMIPALLPLLWRRADISAALAAVGARAIVCAGRVLETDLAEVAVHVAAETFAIRFVLGLGTQLPDGVVPLNDTFDLDTAVPEQPAAVERQGAAAQHIAVVTWDVTAAGLVPVARSHVELLAAATALSRDARVSDGVSIVSAIPPTSLAGLAATLIPWLLGGGTLHCHLPFDPAVFSRQAETCRIAVLPGPVVRTLQEAGVDLARLDAVVALWRSPDRVATWEGLHGLWLVDALVFGEVGLVAALRPQDGTPARLPIGATSMPAGATDGPAIETARTAQGTLALRGAMVPRSAFPPGAERADLPRYKMAEDGFVDTGFPCRTDAERQEYVLDGPPAGIITVGGYRFLLREIQEAAARLGDGVTLAALPDRFSGTRLAGAATDRVSLRQALTEAGYNPLLIGAFRERRVADQASAA